jgi:matrixin
VTRRLTIVAALAVALGLTPSVRAYLKIGTDIGGRIVSSRWRSFPIKYFVTNRDIPHVTAPQLRTALDASFASWAAVNGAGVSAEFAGFTSAEPFGDDGATVIGFQSRPDLDRVLGATTFVVDNVTGAILESDIMLNSASAWSVSGEPSGFDVQSIATHEIGHLLGLGHSALGETEVVGNGRRVIGKAAVMFPIAFPAGITIDRSLDPDDIAGLKDVYGDLTPTRLGSISGHVTLNGAGLYGAHVVAFNLATGALIGGFTLTTAGEYVISGLDPGMYVVRAEPLDDADLDGFFDPTTTVNLNFKPAYGSKLASVPAGGAGVAVEIKVSAK